MRIDARDVTGGGVDLDARDLDLSLILVGQVFAAHELGMDTADGGALIVGQAGSGEKVRNFDEATLVDQALQGGAPCRALYLCEELRLEPRRPEVRIRTPRQVDL